jgi:SAM-dependent methyltransferase
MKRSLLDVHMQCPICQAEASFFEVVEGVSYFSCGGCHSIFAHPDFLAEVESGSLGNYHEAYWAEELSAARERSYGSTIIRLAETLRLARIPVRRILDIGTGPGFLLDALTEFVPNLAERAYGIELFPPALRSRHPHYRTGHIVDLDGVFDAGVCIEVIEHLTPTALIDLMSQLAKRSTPGALYYFNSAQPSFVQSVDRAYLDPYRRGHVISWSLAGLQSIFQRAGFNVITLPGRDWAFLAEFGPPRPIPVETLFEWLWHPLPENLALTRDDRFGSLFQAFGLESARCYLESGLVEERTRWALRLDGKLQARKAWRKRWSISALRRQV